ncbi:SDR family NAD(P)-dependent oxidoreductase [Caballeronia sp. LZ035]|uniref:SDR family NAD(P)-dependent oxidoreductase n=1 Tax=Caballeronia sp. LZ035 TaxID=3038568 RepID=UPI0028607D33|nr:SDR family NAD(P)-dependent oxidoreductase [Caballeronia sp. LZ035]MDR5760607.1 SDR family NAD(P)-dependent oxidoreductase [Caballeronia sp. LZ035]
MKRFEEQVVLVTGGARGIGYAIAEKFAREGASVVLSDVDGATVGEAATQLAATTGARVGHFVCDVGDEAQVEQFIADVLASFGHIDVLVNNAGVTRDNLLFKMSAEDWDMVMHVHLRGTFLCTRAVQRHMVERRRGKIVNLSSTSALGNRGQANYSTAKAGLQAFTRTAAIELGPYNINVNAIAPGFIDTEMTRKTAMRRGIDPEEYKAMRAKSIPLGRVGQPADIANVAAFLCSEDASFVSGQIIYVKGGPETLR